MRVLLSGGGTAGHINPAIAIADLIRSKDKSAAIAFVGTPHGMENRLVGEAGYSILHVNVEGLSRSLSPKNLRALYLAAAAIPRARRILRDFMPDLVIGTGGYVCFPLLRAAAAMGIPCALHESNAVLGLAARQLAPHMDAIWLNFRETADLLPRGCVEAVCTGNPLRRSFLAVTKEEARRRLGIPQGGKHLLSFGGSLGAERLNDAMLRLMRSAQKRMPRLIITHACGERHYEACREKFKGIGGHHRLFPYITDMPLYMASADAVVCRAGAVTISELALCGKCAVLVPSPYVAADHQRKNAALLTQKQAAFTVEENALPENKLENLIFSLFSDDKKRAFSENAIKSFAKPDSCEIIWNEISKFAR